MANLHKNTKGKHTAIGQMAGTKLRVLVYSSEVIFWHSKLNWKDVVFFPISRGEKHQLKLKSSVTQQKICIVPTLMLGPYFQS